jgi:putative two-component system response regulator
MQILAVDDDDIALELMANALGRCGYDVLTASDGRQALELVERTGCRLVVSDWDMPDMTGVELCRVLRAAPLSGYLYFILLTARNTPQEKIEGLSAGADDFIAKPFHPAELTARIQAGERILSLETRDVAIFALARLAESRDPDTGAHLERVQAYSRALAQKLATRPKFQGIIDAEFIRLIYLTSPLHDIGKVGVPDSVLLKQGRLDPQEFEIMKAHTLIGAETLQDALDRFPGARFLEMARDIAATHHEHYDGRGYPRGLKGDEIPLSGRIVAVADVYDALTSKRVYKDMLPHETARELILVASGEHFDPDVVEVFLACEAEFVAVARRYADNGPPASRRGVPLSAWGTLPPLPASNLSPIIG